MDTSHHNNDDHLLKSLVNTMSGKPISGLNMVWTLNFIPPKPLRMLHYFYKNEPEES